MKLTIFLKVIVKTILPSKMYRVLHRKYLTQTKKQTRFRYVTPNTFKLSLTSTNNQVQNSGGCCMTPAGARQKMPKVCVIGNYINENIGGQLTTYAVYALIERLGYPVKMLRFSDHLIYSRKRKLIWEFLCEFTGGTEKNLDKINESMSVFVTCSDWTFCKTFSKGWDLYTQPWTSDNKNRISFAASFGSYDNGRYLEEDYTELQRRLSRFSSLTIREPEGVEFCKKIGVENALFMHDPVFSLDKSFYEALSLVDGIDSPPLSSLVNGKYIAVYFRDFAEKKIQRAKDISIKLGFELLVVMGYDNERAYIDKFQFRKKGLKYITDVTMCEWLYFLNNSEYILTDSFHATCFSLIFNKPFLLFKRCNIGEAFSRLATLVNRMGMPERLLSVDDGKEVIYKLLETPIVWDAVNATINQWRYEAIRFIDNALQKVEIYKT